MNALNIPALPRLISDSPHSPEALERYILSKLDTIETCFQQTRHEFPAPFITSMDLHNYSNQISIGEFSPYAALLDNIDCCLRNYISKSSS